MKVSWFNIQNYCALVAAKAEDLEDLVVIAGPNGSGKSCILDAFRLLKSTYGEYHPQELRQWYQEHHVNWPLVPASVRKFFRDANKEIIIEAGFVLSASERAYLRDNVDQVLTQYAWQSMTRPAGLPASYLVPSMAIERREFRDYLERLKREVRQKVLDALATEVQVGRYTISSDGEDDLSENVVLQLVFSLFDTKHLGVLDYYGAHRSFGYENVGGINLNVEEFTTKMRTHALVGYSGKFQNIKSELASGLIRLLVSREAGQENAEDESIGDSLKELFTTFIPRKKFEGPKPTTDGKIEFNVTLPDGSIHDIDELSSGEKEVVFGYLRLRNSAPSSSVIMLDEPELHLNPLLARGLPDFYRRHIGVALSNQLWLVTHSDALLRESMGLPKSSVFHLEDATTSGSHERQLRPISAKSELDRALYSLAGDLPAWRPAGAVVICEGENSKFDEWMIRQLFPNFCSKFNVLSAGSKKTVARVHELFEQARQSGIVQQQFFSITDRDWSPFAQSSPNAFQKQWGRYHIENYLLDAEIVAKVLQDVNRGTPALHVADAVNSQLLSCAKEVVPSMVRAALETTTNSRMVEQIKTNVNRDLGDWSNQSYEACRQSVERLSHLLTSTLSLTVLQELERTRTAELQTSFVDGSWVERIAGRDVLKRFCAAHVTGVTYEAFRDLLVSKMRDLGRAPEGMRMLLDDIDRIASATPTARTV